MGWRGVQCGGGTSFGHCQDAIAGGKRLQEHDGLHYHHLQKGDGIKMARGFFKGMSFPLATITAYNSLVFGFYSNSQRVICKRRYGDERHPASLSDVAVASMLTGLVSVGLGAPIDLVKIRLQMQTHAAVLTESFQLAGGVSHNMAAAAPVGARSLHVSNGGDGRSSSVYRGPLHCISSVMQREGLQGLYRGGGAMLLRDIPGYALYFVPYAIFCKLLKPDAVTAPHPCAIWLAGGLAGSISWVTATPADVVKSRLQADAHLHRKYNGVLHCILHSYKTEGVQVFFRGVSVNAIRGFPMSATMFLGYELSLQFFQSL
ncbi:solute carrier family 25 member 48 isoform X2 [Syngnathus scovelli]|uniref:solute carrier family 25 member 48 isoform X2 n=1 Tax=Syngnathus scovelli TaxID=161590 RepID=UPI0021104255|nr:solute carrier family 25 member 48 isoform X2 [Syngnathus scovelli]